MKEEQKKQHCIKEMKHHYKITLETVNYKKNSQYDVKNKTQTHKLMQKHKKT